jgi:hypothetical protein
LKQDMHVNVCLSCVESTLCGLAPLLTDILEERYGQLLDEWLEMGRFTSASWTLSSQFQVSEERMRHFVTHLVADALGDGAITLSLPSSDGWVPSHSAELTDVVYERCGEPLRRLVTHSLTETLCGLPTRAAERELIEAAAGRRHSDTPRRRQSAVEAAAFSSASPLPDPARALLEFRYGADCRHFTQCWEGKIDPVWREVAGLLPAEVAALIPPEGAAG